MTLPSRGKFADEKFASQRAVFGKFMVEHEFGSEFEQRHGVASWRHVVVSRGIVWCRVVSCGVVASWSRVVAS